jgi:homoserine O-acetyltransferase
MKKFLIYLFVFVNFNLIQAQSLTNDREQNFALLRNFITQSGDTISDCKIGYRIFGRANSDSTNIILYCTWFGGNSEAIGKLIRKYGFIDTTKYLIIAVDALGNGISSSPSNYSKQFPRITIKDMVNSQYLLLTKHLKLKKVYAVIGGSMGSMQAIQWAVTYPDFMKKVIAYVPSPKLTSYDLLWVNTQIKLIETLQKYNSTEKDIKILSDMMTALISRSSEYVNEKIQTEKFSEYLDSFDKEPDRIFTIENYLSQIKAIRDFDFSSDFNSDFEKAAEHIKSKMFLIISEKDMMVNPMSAIKLSELKGCRTLFLKNNCGHLAVTCEIEKVRKEISDFLEN